MTEYGRKGIKVLAGNFSRRNLHNSNYDYSCSNYRKQNIKITNIDTDILKVFFVIMIEKKIILNL